MGAWEVGLARGIGMAFLMLIGTIAAVYFVRRSTTGNMRFWATIATAIVGYFVIRYFYDPAVDAIESYDAARSGYLGGLGLPIIFSWVVGGVFAGSRCLADRQDRARPARRLSGHRHARHFGNYHRHPQERGMADPRPSRMSPACRDPWPMNRGLQQAPWFLELSAWLGANPVIFSTLYVRLSYAILFAIVLIIIMYLAERALNSPWGRMMRAISR